MAGAGYKLFNTGDVLTAAQVNTYLQEQTVMVFADSAARTTALSGVLAEGMMSYLQDTNSVEVYNGTSWVNVGNAGDITEVQAGTGISVASGTGPIPVVTNTVATTFDAKGDLVAGTGADTFAKLTVGANDTVLTADSSTATGLKWATPASGGWTSLASGTVSGSSTTVNITTTGYKQVVAYLKDATTDGAYFAQVRFNGDSGNNYNFIVSRQSSTTAVTNAASNATDAFYALGMTLKQDSADSFQVVTIQDPANTTTHKLATLQVIGRDSGNTYNMSASVVGQYLSTSAISSITFIPGANYSTGNYEIYGVK